MSPVAPAAARAGRAVLVLLGLLAAAGCDAGRRVLVRAHVEGAPPDVALESCRLRCFWFDSADDDLFSAPVDDQVERVSAVRRNRPSRGVCMERWLSSTIDPQGDARLSIPTFYAGGLPVTELLTGPLEEDPDGAWFEVAAPLPGLRPQGFVVRDRGDGPTLVRVEESDGLPVPGAPAGGIEVLGWDDAERAYVWNVRIPLGPWRRAAPTE